MGQTSLRLRKSGALPTYAGRGHWSLLSSACFEFKLNPVLERKSVYHAGASKPSTLIPANACELFLSSALPSLRSRVLLVQTLNQQKHNSPQKPTSRYCGFPHPEPVSPTPTPKKNPPFLLYNCLPLGLQGRHPQRCRDQRISALTFTPCLPSARFPVL